jgi:hypothetical protein
MDNFRPSRFDRMMEAADEIIRQGFAFVTDDEVPPFEELRRDWIGAPARREVGCDD